MRYMSFLIVFSLFPGTSKASDLMCGDELDALTGGRAGRVILNTIIDESPSSLTRSVLILAAIESGFDPEARSNRSAFGLLQVTLPAAQDVQTITKRMQKIALNKVLSTEYSHYVNEWIQYCDLPEPTEKVLMNPKWSVRYGSCYLQHLLEISDGNLIKALAGYNGGFRQRALLVQQRQIHTETANYITKFHFLKSLATNCKENAI